jgi:AraC-like DNA-binding protein
MALVLSGGYEEAGERGSVSVRAGDLVMHGGYEAHLNRYDADGAEVLNLALPRWFEPHTPVMQVTDPDAVVRVAERDPHEAATMALSLMRPARSVEDHSSDWPDELACSLRSDPNLRLCDWAQCHDLAEETVSRGFQKVFGITPSAYRAQQRARQAWRMVIASRDSLCDVAMHAGFCDQAHMTREVRTITGKAPGEWRRHVKWVQDEVGVSGAFSFA